MNFCYFKIFTKWRVTVLYLQQIPLGSDHEVLGLLKVMVFNECWSRVSSSFVFSGRAVFLTPALCSCRLLHRVLLLFGDLLLRSASHFIPLDGKDCSHGDLWHLDHRKYNLQGEYRGREQHFLTPSSQSCRAVRRDTVVPRQNCYPLRTERPWTGRRLSPSQSHLALGSRPRKTPAWQQLLVAHTFLHLTVNLCWL